MDGLLGWGRGLGSWYPTLSQRTLKDGAPNTRGASECSRDFDTKIRMCEDVGPWG